MHIAFRLDDAALRLYRDGQDLTGYTVGHAVVGGSRSTFYIRDASRDGCSAGAQLHPGAAEYLFGLHSGALAERHTPLGELWGQAVALAQEQLLEARTLAGRLDVLESILSARRPVVRGLHPAVAYALQRLPVTLRVSDVVTETGYSHRHFAALFRDQVGLTPKVFCRVARFQRTLNEARANPGMRLADLALHAGYSDQSHFSREFREFAGITPEEYRRSAPTFPNHVPVPY